MCKKLKKLICLVSFVLALGFAGSANAQAPKNCQYTDEGADHLWTTPENWACTNPNGPGPPNSFDTTAQCKIDGTICQITDGMDVVCKAFHIARDGCTNEAEISGGTLTYTEGLIIGVGRNGGYGYLKVTGGEINGGWLQIPRQFAEQAGQPYEWVVGHLDLFGGTLSCNNLMMGDRVTTDAIGGGTGTIDITEGTLIVKPDETIDTNALLTNIEGFIDNGWITAYGGFGTLNLDVDITNGYKITLTATSGALATEPYPADGAVDVPLDTVLSWKSPADSDNPDLPDPAITQHFVYLLATPADPNADPAYALSRVALATEVTDGVGTFVPEKLEYNITYLWAVDLGINGSQPYDPNTLKGVTWRFTTMADPNAVE